MAAQGTQDHRISIIQGVSSSRTHPVQPVSLSGMTRTLGGFGQCGIHCKAKGGVGRKNCSLGSGVSRGADPRRAPRPDPRAGPRPDPRPKISGPLLLLDFLLCFCVSYKQPLVVLGKHPSNIHFVTPLLDNVCL